MLPAHLAARLLEQRRAEQAAEFARQLPLYAEEMPVPPDGNADCEAPRALPDWATNY